MHLKIHLIHPAISTSLYWNETQSRLWQAQLRSSYQSVKARGWAGHQAILVLQRKKITSLGLKTACEEYDRHICHFIHTFVSKCILEYKWLSFKLALEPDKAIAAVRWYAILKNINNSSTLSGRGRDWSKRWTFSATVGSLQVAGEINRHFASLMDEARQTFDWLYQEHK